MTDPSDLRGGHPSDDCKQRKLDDQEPGAETVTNAQNSTGGGMGASHAESPQPDTDEGVELPETFGRYRVQKRLGRGAMGAVFLAHDTQLNRRVALKVPSFSGGDSEQDKLILRFYQEARSAATLSHPYICPVHDVGQIGGTHFISMGYVEGRSLADEIAAGQKLPEHRVARLVGRLAQGLEEAHQNGVIHRDLKPSNIMINQRDEPIVMDFGLALQLSDSADARLTQDGAVIGSPAYMSPEQVESRGDLGPATDIYSLSVVLYELLTGRAPFQGTAVSVIGRIMHAEPTPISELRPDISPELAAICQRAMAKRPEDRFGSMAEFAEALSAFLEGRTAQDAPHLLTAPVSTNAALEQTQISMPQAGTATDSVTTHQKQSQMFSGWLVWTLVGSTVLSLLAVLFAVSSGFRKKSATPPQNTAALPQNPGESPPRSGDIGENSGKREQNPGGRRPHGRRSPRDPLAGLLPHEVKEMSPAELMDRLDRDGDGRLAGGELPPHVIGRADSDGDREITLDELADGRRRSGYRLFDPPKRRNSTGRESSRPSRRRGSPPRPPR